MNKQHKEREHAKISGSSIYINMNCSGSYFLSKGIPSQTTKASDRGTLAHESAEILVKDFIEYKLNGTDPDKRSNLLSDDEEILEWAHGYKDAIWNNVLKGSITGKAYGIETKIFVSTEHEMFGFVDFWCSYIDDRGKRVLAICDLKTGFIEVEANKNPQLAFYSDALVQEFEKRGKSIDYVLASIYQPKSKVPFKETKFTRKQIDTWHKKFIKTAKTILVEKKAIYKVGSWCEYCKARGICKSYIAAEKKDNSIAVIDEPNIEVEKVSDEMLVKLILSEDKIEGILKSAKAYAINRLKFGKPINGLKLVQNKQRRKWKELEDEIAKTLIEHGIEEPYNKKLKGITEIERELSKKISKKNAIELINNHCDLTSTGVSLVGIDDPRPGINNLIGEINEI